MGTSSIKKLAGQDGSIAFFVEATQESGFGHLSRSIALARQLRQFGETCEIVGRVDPKGLAFAAKESEPLRTSLSYGGEVVVIDALSLDSDESNIIRHYPIRILISSTFLDPSIATHILLRDQVRSISEHADERAQVIIDSNFGFATTQSTECWDLGFDRISVGIYLPTLDTRSRREVVNRLGNSCRIDSILEISDSDCNPSGSLGSKYSRVSFAERPWHFFRNINVFLGGDGIMISESIARGIPTFAIANRVRMSKNQSFIDKGAIEAVLVEQLDVDGLSEKVVSTEFLQNLRMRARYASQTVEPDALARTILCIVRSS